MRKSIEETTAIQEELGRSSKEVMLKEIDTTKKKDSSFMKMLHMNWSIKRPARM